MSKPVIQVAGLSRQFGTRQAVRDVNFEVPAGRVVALIGPNGAGKTTLLRLLMGLIEPTRGEARVLGSPARPRPAGVSLRIGWVGEGHEPPGWASLARMISLQAQATGRFDRGLAQRLLAQRDLSPKRRFGSLSKGQKRWALATLALASRSDLLVMDEPADGLDPVARRGLYDHVRDYVNDTGATAVIATHILGDIERVADDLMLFQAGQIRLHADLEDLREQVREVELPPDAELPDLGPGVEVLARRREADAQLLLVRCDGEAEARLAGLVTSAPVRPVSLEALCVALFESPVESIGNGGPRSAPDAISCT